MDDVSHPDCGENLRDQGVVDITICNPVFNVYCPPCNCPFRPIKQPWMNEWSKDRTANTWFTILLARNSLVFGSLVQFLKALLFLHQRKGKRSDTKENVCIDLKLWNLVVSSFILFALIYGNNLSSSGLLLQSAADILFRKFSSSKLRLKCNNSRSKMWNIRSVKW